MILTNIALIFLLGCKSIWAITTEEEEARALTEIANNINTLKKDLAVLQSFVKLVKTSGSCDDLYEQGVRENGVYELRVLGKKLEAFCEFKKNSTDSTWLVLQRRLDGKVDFYRNWKEYVNGFGNKSDEFWLGLQNISLLTTSHPQLLRVEITDFQNNKTYADYSVFTVMNETNKFKLNVGGHSGSACDALSYHNGMRFTTFDQDNDEVSNKNCANQNHGGWWYRSCFRANLNGRYFSKGGRDFSGIIWFEWGDVPTPKKAVEMKIRPIR